MAETMASMTPAIAEMTALMALPIAEMIEPYDRRILAKICPPDGDLSVP